MPIIDMKFAKEVLGDPKTSAELLVEKLHADEIKDMKESLKDLKTQMKRDATKKTKGKENLNKELEAKAKEALELTPNKEKSASKEKEEEQTEKLLKRMRDYLATTR